MLLPDLESEPPAKSELKRTFIEQVKLVHFRNYSTLTLDLDSRHVVLTGENGAGKTNLLEALSFLSPGRGLRRAPYDAVAQADSAGDGTWAVHAKLHGSEGLVAIGTGLQQKQGGVETQRRIQVNGAATRSSENLLEHVRVVWLTPAMDGLFSGPVGDRRRFLDRMVLAIDPTHGRRVSDFEKAMRGRNKLLEEDVADESWLDGLEAQLAGLGVAIAMARSELAGLLAGIAEWGRDPEGPFPNALIALDGMLENLVADGAAADLEDSFRALLANNRARDRAVGRMLEGPHRTNLLVRHGPKDMEAALCSTGEQKALLVGLVLAHARLVEQLSGAAPILLLDEIVAHLDEGRRGALFDLVDGLNCQAWMTGTDAAMFSALVARAQMLTVASGTVTGAG